MLPHLFDEALRRHEAFELEHEGVRYVRAAADRHELRRGAVLLEGRVLPFYPRIGRVFHLEQGLAKLVWPRTDRVWAEEKIDGYNVRLARAGGRVLPFTRGGFCCPFTADRLADLGDVEPFLAPSSRPPSATASSSPTASVARRSSACSAPATSTRSGGWSCASTARGRRASCSRSPTASRG
jgi:hypothetical protein